MQPKVLVIKQEKFFLQRCDFGTILLIQNISYRSILSAKDTAGNPLHSTIRMEELDTTSLALAISAPASSTTLRRFMTSSDFGARPPLLPHSTALLIKRAQIREHTHICYDQANYILPKALTASESSLLPSSSVMAVCIDSAKERLCNIFQSTHS